MRKQMTIDLLESSYPNAGFMTELGHIAPFYGRVGRYVIVGGAKYLTPTDARRAAAALLTAAETVEGTATDAPTPQDRAAVPPVA